MTPPPTPTSTPKITLFFLQASRSIRCAWLLEELELPYNVEFSNRVDRVKQAPPEFKAKAGNPLGKFPSLVDRSGDEEVKVWESGAIVDYLLSTYDTTHRLLPTSSASLRSACQIWIHAAEGTFMLHALAITYAQWNFPSSAVSPSQAKSMLDAMTSGMAKNVQNDFDWLERTLKEQEERMGGRKEVWLVGEELSAADVMMEFSVDFILARGLGVPMGGEGEEFEEGGRWGRVRGWLERCHAREGYRRAVERTGFTLHPE